MIALFAIFFAIVAFTSSIDSMDPCSTTAFPSSTDLSDVHSQELSPSSDNAITSSMTNSSSQVGHVDGCFGKIRTASSVDREFRASMDRMSMTARLDKIDELLRKKITQLCTEVEAAAANDFLNEKESSTHIVRSVAMNLTDDEKGLINLWENLNDTLSERIFFLNKFENLPKDQYEQLTRSFSEVLNKFVNSDLKRPIASFLTRLTPAEQNDLRTFGEKFDEEKLMTLIDNKLKEDNVSADERDEIEDYLKKLFMIHKSA